MFNVKLVYVPRLFISSAVSINAHVVPGDFIVQYYTNKNKNIFEKNDLTVAELCVYFTDIVCRQCYNTMGLLADVYL